MIDKNMMRIILVLAICFLVGCASNENVVSIEQVESTNSVVLRMKKDKNSIFSLSYPLSFKDKENNSLTSSYKIFNDSTSYIIDKNDTIKERMSAFYGKGSMRDTVRIQVHKQMYELTMSVDSAKGGCAQSPVIVSVKLTKGGKPAGESIFPLPGDYPDEEDISIEGSDKGFTIKCSYCEGFYLYIGYAQFGYSERLDDFVLAGYKEEIIDRLFPESESKTVEYKFRPEKPLTLCAFSIQAVKNLIHRNIAQEYEIVQTRTGLYPVFAYSFKRGKLMWIECPVEFVIHNRGKNRLSVLDHPSYYGYVNEAIYNIKNNPSKRWNRELIYRVEGDSIGDYLDFAESIFPNESKRFIIMPRIFVYKNPEFQKLFEDTVAVMARSHKESRWPVAPSSLSIGQRKFLKELISGDSLRVRFYLDSLHRHHAVNISLDTDLRFTPYLKSKTSK